MCSRWPECDSYVGLHQGTLKPKGTLADAPTREARKKAHAAFDPLWRWFRKDDAVRRNERYAWLAKKLGVAEAHIGEADVETCQKIVQVCMNEAVKTVPKGWRRK